MAWGREDGRGYEDQQCRDASHGDVPCARSSHAAASAFHRAEKIHRPAYGVIAHVLGKNCARPLDPDGFRARGSSPDSQRHMRMSSPTGWRNLRAA